MQTRQASFQHPSDTTAHLCLHLPACLQNFKLVQKVKEIADKKGCTPGQLALAWVHSKGDDIFPIPGEEMTISPLFGAACTMLPSACSAMAVTWMLHKCLQHRHI